MLQSFLKRAENYKMTFSTEAGQEVLKDLAKICGAYTSSHVVGDPYTTAFNEGRRDVFNYIMRTMEVNAELFQQQHLVTSQREQLSSFLEE